MKENRKRALIFLTVFLIFLIDSPNSLAKSKEKFLSLKNNEVNLRIGPSFEYPIKLIYKKKYLPVTILDTSETWRQIKDFKSNSGWIHVSQLSNKKSGININAQTLIYTKPTIYSKPIAKVEVGRLLLISKCKIKWCKIKSGKFKGWVLKKNFWGPK